MLRETRVCYGNDRQYIDCQLPVLDGLPRLPPCLAHGQPAPVKGGLDAHCLTMYLKAPCPQATLSQSTVPKIHLFTETFQRPYRDFTETRFLGWPSHPSGRTLGTLLQAVFVIHGKSFLISAFLFE